MVEKTVTIKSELGLHLRPAGLLCGKAMEYESQILIRFRNREFNAKSVLSVLSACVQQMDEITLVCKGADEKKALEELTYFLENEI